MIRAALLCVLMAAQASAGDMLIQRDDGFYLLRSTSTVLEGPLPVYDQRGDNPTPPPDDDTPTPDDLSAQAKKVRDFSVGVLTKQQGEELALIINMLYRQMETGALPEARAEEAITTALTLAGGITKSTQAYNAWLQRFNDQTVGTWQVRLKDATYGLAAAFNIDMDTANEFVAAQMAKAESTTLAQAQAAIFGGDGRIDIAAILQLILQLLIALGII